MDGNKVNCCIFTCDSYLVFFKFGLIYDLWVKFSIILQKPKCVKYGRRLQVDIFETNYNDDKITAYCFKREKHAVKVLKFKIEPLF